MTDPRFPDRPQHPDFWRLATAVQDNDHQADAGQEVNDIIGRYADVSSVTYMAQQRCNRFAAVLGRGVAAPAVLALQSGWLDGFTAGARYQALTALEDKTPLAHNYPASDEAVQTVLNAPTDTGDGRSEWRWVRLPNGDLMLAVFPQGDTYFEVEVAVGEDYERAEKNGTLNTVEDDS